MYSIGQVSQMFHVPISTLRYYDQQGLFPQIKRVGGIRQFGPDELEALRVIECLKKSGLQIKDIKQFMQWCAQGSQTYEQRRALFLKQKQQVEEEMHKLNQVLDLLNFKCWYYEKALQDGNEQALKNLPSADMPPEIRAAYERFHRNDNIG